MKTILRMIIILLVAALVAGGFYLAVNNTSSISGSSDQGGQPPAMTGADGQTMQPPSRPEGGPGGDREGGASLGGLSQILVTLAKLSGITIIALLVEKGVGLLAGKKTLRIA